MKLLKFWTRTLSIGAATMAFTGPLVAQGPIFPGKPGNSGIKQTGSMSYMGGPDVQVASYNLAPDTPMGVIPASAYQYCDSASAMGGNGMACGPGMDCGPGLGGHFGNGRGPGLGLFGPENCGPDCNAIGAGVNDPSACCQHCGFAGCPHCGWGLGLFVKSRLNKCIGALLPNGEGGLADQRHYDFYAGAMVLRRDSSTGLFNFTSQGLGSNNFVLSSNDVNFDSYRWGLQLQAVVQVAAGTNVEVDYFGLNRWNETATVTSTTPTLFSFISGFGTDPNNGFDDPDRSFSHSISYTSALNNGEVNFRRRWVGPYQWFQGSWLAGVRLVDLDETATFSARGENNDTAASNGLRFFDYSARTRNTMTGFQIGSDLWMNLVPGIKAGLEVKSGVFGNKTQQNTSIDANSITGFTEGVSDGRVAYVGQLTASMVYRVSYSWTIRSSYQCLYLDNVALATENFNVTPPTALLTNSSRTPTINNDGEVTYTGFSAGAEYIW